MPAGSTAHRRPAPVLLSVGLPTGYPPDAFDELLDTMALDKKTRGSTLRFVILNGLASAEILAGPAEELLREAYAAVLRPADSLTPDRCEDGRHDRGLGRVDLRDAFGEAARVFAGLVRAMPPDGWDGPGLGEWDLRALVGHTCRALITVETYLRAAGRDRGRADAGGVPGRARW